MSTTSMPAAAHLLSLINDLLDLSKVEAGKLELNFTAVNLGEVVDHAMKMLQEQATCRARGPAQGLAARAAQCGGRSALDAADHAQSSVQRHQVHRSRRPGDRLGASSPRPGELKLRVKDTGIGMDDDQLRDALEPFRRVSTEGREVQGTGLGLPLTKALAEANRAAFAICSEPRKGTLAEITFPTTRVLAE